MVRPKLEWRERPAVPTAVDQLLADRYRQLLQWGAVLTRGDVGHAEEIVQELCLYFTLTQPEISKIANLDGYLYTSLRHIYLSRLARASREALRFVSVAEFDSFDVVLDHDAGADPLEKQNDLRRICQYAVWRKESSKSASYFILHFFLGYARKEIAELACLPVSAIYNKLKIARSEVKLYLEAPGKLHVVQHGLPAEPSLSWSLLSTPGLFAELRDKIWAARTSNCLYEGELLEHYRAGRQTPIPCALMAHIVCCERCLSILDQYFRRPGPRDRSPLDCLGSSETGENNKSGTDGIHLKTGPEVLREIRRRWARTHDHRPAKLSIAVNGQVIAFHDVKGEHSTLSARIGRVEEAKFVEVFSEQDVRLALLSLGPEPPAGAAFHSQRAELSDERWLELRLAYDGQGLQTEVAYFDPALATLAVEEEPEPLPAHVQAWQQDSEEKLPGSRLRSAASALGRLLRAATPAPVFAWALLLVVLFATAGYMTYRHAASPRGAIETLEASIKVETDNLRGQTEHQLLQVDEVSPSGRILDQGTVELWKDGDGHRYLRRLYDARHRPLAVEWRNTNGEHRSQRTRDPRNGADSSRSSAMDEFWDQDLSSSAFRTLAGQIISMRALKEGYELTASGPIASRPQLISAVLVLDGHLQPFKVTLKVRSKDGVHEVRFVQASHELSPRGSVPDSVFDPGVSAAQGFRLPSFHAPDSAGALDRSSLAELQIGVLYQLNLLGADTGEPIEVERTSTGSIRVSGVVADKSVRQRIGARLAALPGHRFLDLKLLGNGETQNHKPLRHEDIHDVYEIDSRQPAADATLRQYFQAKGISGDNIDATVITFYRGVLDHDQHALQHAYALERLGGALSEEEFQSISFSARQQWTEMTHQHAAGLEQQLLAIRNSLAPLSSIASGAPDGDKTMVIIENPSQFSHAAEELLQQVQQMDRQIGEEFTAGTAADNGTGHQAFPNAIVKVIPLAEARELLSFSSQLSVSANLTQEQREHPEARREAGTGPK
jgi:DNA-directed RNA polymerase specialized sigma24 family protein